MKVTESVIMDLLPVYLSGEASADTRELIEEFLRQNPEFSRVVEAQRLEFNAQRELLGVAGTPSTDHELRTLARTRALMNRQKWTMAAALALTAFPFSFVVSDNGFNFLMVRDQPLLAAAGWLAAGVLWIVYIRMRRRLRLTGLPQRITKGDAS